MPLPGILPFIPSIVQGVTGLFQLGGKKDAERKFEQELAKMPVYGGSPEIARNYQQALQRANVGLGQLESTKLAQREQARNMSNILSYAASRPGGQGLLANLYDRQNLGMQRIYEGAEREKNRRMGELSRAAQLQASDQGKIFESKRQKQANMVATAAQKAGQEAIEKRAALSNITSAAINAGRVAMAGSDSGLFGKSKLEKPMKPSELIESGAISPITSKSLRGQRQLVPDQITEFNMPEGQETNLYNILSKRRRGWSM